jgi:hypothetical protein
MRFARAHAIQVRQPQDASSPSRSSTRTCAAATTTSTRMTRREQDEDSVFLLCFSQILTNLFQTNLSPNMYAT